MDFLLCATRGLRWLRVCCCKSVSVEGWLSVGLTPYCWWPGFNPANQNYLATALRVWVRRLVHFVCTAGSEAHPNILRMAPMILCTAKTWKSIVSTRAFVGAWVHMFFSLLLGASIESCANLGWEMTGKALSKHSLIPVEGFKWEVSQTEWRMLKRIFSPTLTCCVCKVFVDASKINHKIQTNYKSVLIREIWLILPVVICLFQGLSHACLRITAFAGICAWLITSDVIYRKNVADFREIGYLGEKSS